MQTVLVQVLLYQFEHGLRRNFFGWKSGGGDGAGGRRRHVTTDFSEGLLDKNWLRSGVLLELSCLFVEAALPKYTKPIYRMPWMHE